MLSRVADACYWLSRYIERAETNARLLDVNMQLLLDLEIREPDAGSRHWEPIIATLEDQELFHRLYHRLEPETVMEFVTFERQNPNSILSCIARARENARSVREQITSEMWEQLNRLYLYLKSPPARNEYHSSPYHFYQSVIRGSQLFQGVTDATMTHGEGWRFIQAGKYIERADSTSRVLDMKYHIILPSGEYVGGNIDITQWLAVLRSCSALEPFTRLHCEGVKAWSVSEFLILHQQFPRSIRFCVDHLDQVVHSISGSEPGAFSNETERLTGLLRSSLDYTTISAIFHQGLHQYLDSIQQRLTEISMALTTFYCKE